MRSSASYHVTACSRNSGETGVSKELWERLARDGILINGSYNVVEGKLKTLQNEMFDIFRLAKPSHNPSLVPVWS